MKMLNKKDSFDEYARLRRFCKEKDAQEKALSFPSLFVATRMHACSYPGSRDAIDVKNDS